MSSEALPNKNSALKFEVQKVSDTTAVVHVIILQSMVKKTFEYLARIQQEHVSTLGFSTGKVPLSYIQQEFRVTLLTFLKEFFLKFCVMNFLLSQLRNHKLIIVGSPVLRNIVLEPESKGIFCFDLMLFAPLTIQEWKLLPFKSPKRKNYRDIDRQVEGFIKKEVEAETEQKIEYGDWVCFSLTLVDHNQRPLLENFSQYFWFCLKDEEVENALQSVLLGKKVGDNFLIDKTIFYDTFTTHLDGVFPLLLKIEHAVSYKVLCFEKFKKHFRLKTQKDVHKKLIEVFSFRNDLSQRHLIVDEAFKLLLSKHRFAPPYSLVTYYEELILRDIKKTLDYSVYKKEKRFSSYVRQLAEKQVREILFIEMLAHAEELDIQNDDVCSYLNLTSRQRTQQLLHFILPATKLNGQEIPCSEEYIKTTCFREKALNYMIYHLTK